MMRLWIGFISLWVRVAVWLKSHFRSMLWKPQHEETNCVLGQVDGSALHHGEDQLVQGTAVVDASDSTSWRSRDAPDFGLQPILSAISQDEELEFWVFYKSSGEVDKSNPYLMRNVWKTIVRSVSKDRDVCIDISRSSEVPQSTVVLGLKFSEDFVAEEEISVVFIQEFANAVRSNQRIERVHILIHFFQEPDMTLATRFGTLVMNMIPVVLESPSLRSVSLENLNIYGSGIPLGRAAVESLVSALRRNVTLTRFDITNGGQAFFDTEGLKSLLEPLLIGGEGSYQGLKTLQLDATGIDDERAEVVASMLQHNTSLTCIRLRFNKIGPQGAASIAEALRSNTTLRELDINDNPIGEAGLKALVASLTHNMADGDLQPNSSLTHLGIAYDLNIDDMEPLGTLVRQNASLLRLNLSYSLLLGDADSVIRLLQDLKSNKCLEEVLLRGCEGVVGRRVLGTIFDLLDVNHHLKKLDLDRTPLAADGGAEMVKAVLEQKAKHNMWEVLQAMATARPNSARIFLCGCPFAGKTTLCQTIMKAVNPLDLNGMSKGRKQRTSTRLLSAGMLRKGKSNHDPREVTPRTRGIEVHGMSLDDIMVTIWDMAGQDDYHSFHDLVIPNLTGNSGSSCSFLLVCNPLQLDTHRLKSVQVIGDELLYWLRFIASNSRISTAYKPHVIISVTNLDMVGPDYESVSLPRIKDKVEWLRNLFQDILEIDLQVFAVNALSIDSIRFLLETMKSHLKFLLGRLPHVFEACSRMQVLIARWNREHLNQPLVRWKEFCKLCDNVEELKSHKGLGREVVERKKEVVAISLHDSGHLMYNEELDFVVLNPHWFCHDIIGRVLKCKELDSLDDITNGTMTKVDFKHVVNASLQPNLQGFSFDDLLQMMIKLEFCYEHDEDTVLIPALLQDVNDQSSLGKRQLHWPPQEKDSNWQYVGRRMLCSDKARTVLTLGFFPRLQVVFQRLFGRDNGKYCYKLAKNMISFYTRGMEVILESSGQIGFDIDIMARSSKFDKDVMLEFLHTHVMKPIHDLCAHHVLGCQGVQLVEGILRPTCVERLIPRIHREHQVVLVEDLQSIVLATCDFSYEHNWKEDGPLRGGHDDAETLLGKKAWENILNRHLGDLQKLQKVLSCDTKHEELMATQPKWMDDGDEVMGEVRIADVQKSVQRVYHRIEEIEANIIKRVDDMESRITTKLNHVISMQNYMLPKICENIDKLMTFSVELQQSQVPRLVYFTTTPKKSLKRIVTRMVPGLTNLKMHFMCENRGGFHIVYDQKGCDVTFGTEATRVFQTILVWGLRIFTILAKVGAHLAAGMGTMIPGLAKDFMLVLDTPGLLDDWKLPYVDETNDCKLQTLTITDDDKRIAEQWLIKFLKEKNLYSSFSLQKAMYKNSMGGCHRTIAWLCNDHIKEGEDDSSLDLLPC